MWVDWSYGINGVSYCANDCAELFGAAAYYPCTSISYSNGQVPPLKKRTATKDSSDLVFMFDGKEWNMWNSPSVPAGDVIVARLSGWRHGGWVPGKPDSSGRVNVSFMDGHVATFPRNQLPDVTSETDGSWTNTTPDQMSHRFNYPHWRLDQERGGVGIAGPPPSR